MRKSQLFFWVSLIFSLHTAIAQVKVSEDFDVSLTPTGWTNSINTGTLISRLANVQSYGRTGTAASVRANCYNVGAGSVARLETPVFASSVAGDSLRFDVAHAAYPATTDSLVIYTFNGVSFSRLIGWGSSQTANPAIGITTANAQTAVFTPTSSQWTTKALSLPVGTTQVRFEFKSGYGNQMYIDRVIVDKINTEISVTSSAGFANATYPTLKAAFDAINAGMHQGNINVRLNSSVTETATCVLDSSGNATGSNYTSILIRPADTTTVVKSVSTSAAIALMTLNGADNVTFDGRPGGIGAARLLEFNHTVSAATNFTCRFDVGATNNIFRFCRLLNASAASTAHNVHLTNTVAGSSANSNNSFLSNLIQGGRNGIVFDAVNANAPMTNMLIRNNQFVNIGFAGVSNLNNLGQVIIDSNSFYHEVAFTSPGQARAISLGGLPATVSVTATITKNRIFGLKSTNTAIFGIIITPPATATGSLYNISNNSIAFMDANSAVNGGAIGGVNGIAVTGTGSGEFNIYQNTIRIGGAAVGGTAATLTTRSVGVGKFNSGTANIFRLRNNIINNTRTGGASTQNGHMAVWINTTTAGTHDIDRNTYQGTTFVAGWGGTVFATVTGGYQTAAAPNEVNTNQKTPTYLNDTEPYLSGASNGDVDLSTTRIATVLTDIDNNTRAATCYKGAWESSTPFAVPATVTVSGSLVGFTSCSGAPSAEQSFTVSGSNLTANIIVTPPTGFEVSTTSGSGFSASLTLTQTSGTVASTTIYTRLTSSATGTPSGNITVESTGVTTQNVAVNGTVNDLPTITLGTVANVNTTATSFILPYTATTGSPNQYSIITGSPTAMASFSAVSNASLPTSPISVTIPTSVANTYNFVATVRNSTTGCVSTNNNFNVTVTPTTTITSINRGTPSVATTNATSVTYNITFGASITGLSSSNFSLTTNGVTGASIGTLSGSGANYTLTVNTGTGSGSIILNLANASGLSSTISTTLPFVGETYTIDKINPTVVTQNRTLYLNAAGTGSISAAQVNNGSSDASGIASLSLSQTSFNCINVITPVTVTLTVFDNAGNSNTGTATITVLDTVRPVVNTQNRTVYLSAAGTATLSALQLNNGTSDACGVASLSASQTSYTCANVGTPVTVTLTATDLNGNTNTGTATVTVLDTVRPVVNTQNRTVYLSAAGTATVSALQLNNGTTDACGVASLSASQTLYTCANVGAPVTVTLTATDLNGNTNTGTATVTVLDTVRPVVNTQNRTVYLSAAGTATVSALQLNNGTSDACGVASLSSSQTLFTCANVGTPVTVTLTATDLNGNTKTGTATVTVLDTVRPVVNTQNRTVYLSASGTATLSALQLNNGTSDACGVASLSASQTSYTCANVGTPVTVTLTATDLNGNTNTGTATVTVLDTVRPVVNTQNRTVYLTAAGTATVSALQLNNGTSDACGVATLSASQTSYTCANVGTPVTVTLTATDLNGNTKTGTATVTVLDTIKPVVVTQNITVQLVSGVATITGAQINNGSSDACGIASLSVLPNSFTTANLGANTVTLTVTDVNGNLRTGTATVTVSNPPPTITSFTPLSAKPGDAVTITGTNFNTTPANNIVFFGATRATVTAATATSLTVTVPVGATYAAITALNTGSSLAAYSRSSFTPTYSPTKTNITTGDFAAKVDFASGTEPYSVAMGDLDGDGKADLVVANYQSNTVSVYRNTATNGSITTGSFATKVDFATGINPAFAAIGDVDGDGKLDLVVANEGSDSISVLRNTATSGSITTGSFAAKVNFMAGTKPYSVAISDLDGDGKADLAVGNYMSNTISVFRNTATSGSITTGSFAGKVDFAVSNEPSSVAINDLDGDGKPDLAVANYGSATVSILRNTATTGSITTGSFAAKQDFSTGTNPYSIAIGDLDGDGKADIAVANEVSATVSVLRNTATSGSITAGSFASKVDFTTGTNPYSVAIGDLDGNGKLDLVVANATSSTVSVFRNTATSGSITTGSFAAKVDFATGASPYLIAIGDLDGDGRPDLATANGTDNSVSVLRNATITLPSILGSFTANRVENTVALKFITLAEVNSDYIEVEHSVDAVKFITLEKLAAKGNSTIATHYSSTHINPTIGVNYYRLKLVDKNGKYTYSEIRKVDFKSKASEIIVYPNPVKGGRLTIDLGETITINEAFTITAVNGKIVQQGIINNRQQTINIGTLAQGTYILKVGSRQTVTLFIE